MKKELIMLGIIDEDGYEIDNRVYGRGGCSPTERHGNAKIKIVRKYDKRNRCNREKSEERS